MFNYTGFNVSLKIIYYSGICELIIISIISYNQYFPEL